MRKHRRSIGIFAAIFITCGGLAWVAWKLGWVPLVSGFAVGTGSAVEMTDYSAHAPSHMLQMSADSTMSADHSTHGGDSPESFTAEAERRVAMISPEMQQLFGIRKVRPKMMDLTKDLTTFGVVEYDESSIKVITTRYGGWVTRIFVDFTGAEVNEGDLLAMIYSPEVLTASEELILAAQARDRLKNSPYPEVASGSRSLFEKTWRRMELLGLSSDQIQAVLDSMEPIEDFPVYAPFSGTVIKKAISEGSRVFPGDPLYHIADLSRLWLIASFYETDAAFVRVGDVATITFNNRPGKNYSAHVSFIYPNLDPATRTFRVRFNLKVPKSLIQPGMFANVHLHLNLGRYLVVPEDAVMDTGVRQLVFVENGEGHFMAHPVVTGPTANGWTAILSGLTPEDVVVADAAFFVDAESKIRFSMGHTEGMVH